MDSFEYMSRRRAAKVAKMTNKVWEADPNHPDDPVGVGDGDADKRCRRNISVMGGYRGSL